MKKLIWTAYTLTVALAIFGATGLEFQSPIKLAKEGAKLTLAEQIDEREELFARLSDDR